MSTKILSFYLVVILLMIQFDLLTSKSARQFGYDDDDAEDDNDDNFDDNVDDDAENEDYDQSSIERKLPKLHTLLGDLIPTEKWEYPNPSQYMKAMETFNAAVQDILPDLEDDIEEINDNIDDDDKHQKKAIKNAREVLQAIDISAMELNAVTKKQRRDKKKRFLKPIANDAKESVLATIEGVSNLIRTLKDVKDKNKRGVDGTLGSFGDALEDMVRRMASQSKSKRKKY